MEGESFGLGVLAVVAPWRVASTGWTERSGGSTVASGTGPRRAASDGTETTGPCVPPPSATLEDACVLSSSSWESSCDTPAVANSELTPIRSTRTFEEIPWTSFSRGATISAASFPRALAE